MTVRSTNGYVWPASHSAGTTAGALPMGARLRLKASKDLSGYPPDVQRIFRAMQTYGLIVADNGTDMYIIGHDGRRWNNDELNPAFASLNGERLRGHPARLAIGESAQRQRIGGRRNGRSIFRTPASTDTAETFPAS